MNKNIEINADNIEMHYYTDKFFLNYEVLVKWGGELGVVINFRIGRNRNKYKRIDIDTYVYSAMHDLNEYFDDYLIDNQLDDCDVIVNDNVMDKIRQFILKTASKKEITNNEQHRFN